MKPLLLALGTAQLALFEAVVPGAFFNRITALSAPNDHLVRDLASVSLARAAALAAAAPGRAQR